MNATDLPTPLVGTDWLADNLHRPDLRIVDASWMMPAWQRDAEDEWRARHIPGALFFDIDRIATPADETGLPHMIPTPQRFAAQVGAMGIGNDHAVVVYDSLGLFSAPRAWWLFRLFGHDRVAVLDGGLKKWLAEGRPTDDRPRVKPPARFEPAYRPALVRDWLAVESALAEGDEQVVDARDRARFRGEVPEIREGVRSGHVPGAMNLPFIDLVDGQSGTLKPSDQVAEAMATAGVDPSRPVISMCGSGITACVLALALARDGLDDIAVYDGSWTEWGGRSDLPAQRND